MNMTVHCEISFKEANSDNNSNIALFSSWYFEDIWQENCKNYTNEGIDLYVQSWARGFKWILW